MGRLIDWRRENKYMEREPLEEEVFTEKEQCKKCGGNGFIPDECENCEGTTRIMLNNGETINCMICEETGEIEVVCEFCNGNKERQFKVIKRKPTWSSFHAS